MHTPQILRTQRSPRLPGKKPNPSIPTATYGEGQKRCLPEAHRRNLEPINLSENVCSSCISYSLPPVQRSLQELLVHQREKLSADRSRVCAFSQSHPPRGQGCFLSTTPCAPVLSGGFSHELTSFHQFCYLAPRIHPVNPVNIVLNDGTHRYAPASSSPEWFIVRSACTGCRAKPKPGQPAPKFSLSTDRDEVARFFGQTASFSNQSPTAGSRDIRQSLAEKRSRRLYFFVWQSQHRHPYRLRYRFNAAAVSVAEKSRERSSCGKVSVVGTIHCRDTPLDRVEVF